MKLRSAILFATLAFALAGCTSYADVQPGYQDHLDSRADYEQSEEYLEAEGDYYAGQQRADDFATSGWQCYWDPTMNDDWHDDYQCSDGVNNDRPYLIPDDSFVEGWELDAAVAEYEASLNQ
ncbi:hypothetical protein [Cryobacterium arcticum]|uniref:Lipoprotein n=1 Tax=Cryobacterium arcticum TaxID=670052 RepID=A0A317ZQN4_9MICO|nr:hypothetical protein [Cryobacterium arcticum]PXA67074.1 hypothetical protein CTB96_09880 [Cryobacterium arcticum]